MKNNSTFTHPLVAVAVAEVAELETHLANALQDASLYPLRVETAARLIGVHPVTLGRTYQNAYGLQQPPVTVEPDDVAAIYRRVKEGATPLDATNAWLTEDVYSRRSNLS